MCKDDKARRITVLNLKLIQTKIIQLVKLLMLMQCRQGKSENFFVHLNVNVQKMQARVKIPS